MSPLRWALLRPEIKRLLPAVAAAALCAALAGCAPGRTVESARLLMDIAGDSAGADEKVARRAVSWRVEGRQRAGDLYEAAETRSAALVLVPGVAPRGKDDPRLVSFARALAGAGFAVLVPDIESLRALRVGSGDIRAAADAMRYFTREHPPRPVGICGISYAAGPALLATLEPDVRPQVRFLLSIGGYHAMETLIAYVTTGGYRSRADAPWRFGEPNPYGRWVFLKSNAHKTPAPRDRALLTAIAERRIRNEAAPVDDLVTRLGPGGEAVWALMTNRDPARVAGLIAALPEAMQQEIEALDPSRRDLARLAPTLILIHGRDDRIIPHTESEALAAAVPDRAHLYLVDSLAHVDLALSGIGDAVTLWQAVYRLLTERDAMLAAE